MKIIDDGLGSMPPLDDAFILGPENFSQRKGADWGLGGRNSLVGHAYKLQRKVWYRRNDETPIFDRPTPWLWVCREMRRVLGEELRVPIDTAIFNDLPQVTKEDLARVWNRTLYRLGKTEGNQESKPLEPRTDITEKDAPGAWYLLKEENQE